MTGWEGGWRVEKREAVTVKSFLPGEESWQVQDGQSVRVRPAGNPHGLQTRAGWSALLRRVSCLAKQDNRLSGAAARAGCRPRLRTPVTWQPSTPSTSAALPLGPCPGLSPHRGLAESPRQEADLVSLPPSLLGPGGLGAHDLDSSSQNWNYPHSDTTLRLCLPAGGGPSLPGGTRSSGCPICPHRRVESLFYKSYRIGKSTG